MRPCASTSADGVSPRANSVFRMPRSYTKRPDQPAHERADDRYPEVRVDVPVVAGHRDLAPAGDPGEQARAEVARRVDRVAGVGGERHRRGEGRGSPRVISSARSYESIAPVSTTKIEDGAEERAGELGRDVARHLAPREVATGGEQVAGGGLPPAGHLSRRPGRRRRTSPAAAGRHRRRTCRRPGGGTGGCCRTSRPAPRARGCRQSRRRARGGRRGARRPAAALSTDGEAREPARRGAARMIAKSGHRNSLQRYRTTISYHDIVSCTIIPAMTPRPTDEDYQRLLELRTGLRRFLRWSEQQAEAAGVTPAQHQLLLASADTRTRGGRRSATSPAISCSATTAPSGWSTAPSPPGSSPASRTPTTAASCASGSPSRARPSSRR